jgi:hypothetical protein
MIRINISNGKTFRLDLNDEEQAKKLVELLGEHSFQESITGITVMRRYARRHRCSNQGCKRMAKLVCPVCGEIGDGGYFNYTGNQYTLVRPNSFDRVSFAVENSVVNGGKGVNGGEKLICNAGDVQLQIMAYAHQPSARVTLRKIGKQRYNPIINLV